jgi:hypothetical protein
MGRIATIAGLVVGGILAFGSFARLESQSKPDRGGKAVTPAGARQRPPRTVDRIRPNHAEATLVTTVATIQPAQPTAGQSLQVVATVEHQAGPPSKKGLGFFVVCDQVTGGPKCPGQTFASTMPAIAYGTKHQVVVALKGSWPAGTYRLVAGTDVVFGHDMRELELIVKPGRLAGIPMKRGGVRQSEPPSSRTATASSTALRAADPQLWFAIPRPNTNDFAKGPVENTVYRSSANLQLTWNAPIADQSELRWQVSRQPYPSTPSVAPAGLLQEGSVPPALEKVFGIDLMSFPPLGAKKTPASRLTLPQGQAPDRVVHPPSGGGQRGTARAGARADVGRKPASGALPPAVDGPNTGNPPAVSIPAGSAVSESHAAVGPPDNPALNSSFDFYIRIIRVKDGKLAGPPSNTVIAHYRPGLNPDDPAAGGIDPTKQEKAQQALYASAAVYEATILSIKLPVFENPSRWGCVVVLANPYHGKIHPLGKYKAGEEYCPPKDPDKMQKSAGEQVVEGLEGFGKAWDGLAWAYDQAQGWVADQFKELVPCEWLGDEAESTCEDIAKGGRCRDESRPGCRRSASHAARSRRDERCGEGEGD